jgi:hypothetical protein
MKRNTVQQPDSLQPLIEQMRRSTQADLQFINEAELALAKAKTIAEKLEKRMRELMRGRPQRFAPRGP